jgi:lipopolysaccharide export system protein LptA
MNRRLALAAVVGWSAVTLATAAWAQPVPSGPRPARPAAAAQPTAPRPDGAVPSPEGRNAPVTVDADQLENLQKEGLVVFTGNVVANQNSSTQYADRMEVYLDDKGNRIVRTVSTGNVRIITKDCRTGTAKRAEYYDAEQRVVLIGNARVWRDDNVVTGERITIYLAEDRSIVEGGQQERVKAVFYPKNQDEAARPKVQAGQCS